MFRWHGFRAEMRAVGARTAKYNMGVSGTEVCGQTRPTGESAAHLEEK